MTSKRLRWVLKCVLGALFFIGLGAAYAATEGSGIGAQADVLRGNLGQVAKLITGGAYLLGFGIVLVAILKFKAHKDNPTQVPISMGIALLFVGAALIFLPSVFGVVGKTIGLTETSGVSGTASIPKT